MLPTLPLCSSFLQVNKGGPSVLEKRCNEERSLFLCYPDDFEGETESLGLRCLHAFEGDVVRAFRFGGRLGEEGAGVVLQPRSSVPKGMQVVCLVFLSFFVDAANDSFARLRCCLGMGSPIVATACVSTVPQSFAHHICAVLVLQVIHVGELFGDSISMTPGQSPWGRTTSRECQEELSSKFHCILKVPFHRGV